VDNIEIFVMGTMFLSLFLYLLKKVDHMDRSMVEMLMILEEVKQWVKEK